MIDDGNDDSESDNDDNEILGISNDPIPMKLINKHPSPTMEFINVTNSRPENHNKYQRLKELRNVIGFVVNVHDATNFDIDLDMAYHEKYQDVISNQYTYQDFNQQFLETA